MASVALDGIGVGTADGLTRPGTWLVSRHDLAATASFARP